MGMRILIGMLLVLGSLWCPAFGVDVYVVAGQSNGWRLSHLAEGGDRSGPVVHHFGMDCVSEPDTARMATLAGLNPETMGYGLVDALRKVSGKEVVLIQYCRCGAPVTARAANSWFLGSDPANGDAFSDGLMPRFEKYVRSAREQVEASGRTWEVKGLVWHQGESDVSSDKVVFERALRGVFDRFRALFGRELPIVAGHIRELGEGQRAVNAVLDRLAGADPLMVTVGLEGVTYEKDDKEGRPNVHIDRSGCQVLGRRLAAGLSGLRLASAVVKAGGKVEEGNGGGIESIDLYNGNNPLKGKGGRNEVVTDDWLSCLADCSTLKRLSLSNCAITNAGLVHLRGLTGLEELNLTLTPVSDEGLVHLSGLKALRVISLASTQCTGGGFVHLRSSAGLENVNFHFTPFDDEGLREVAKTGVSGRLWFAHTRFTDQGAAVLSQMGGLRICGMGSKAEGSSGEAVAHLKGLGQLAELTLMDNQADAVGIAHAAEIGSLVKLDVSYAPKADDDCLRKVSRMRHLEEFSIGGSALVTGEGLLALAEVRTLKRLRLGKMKNVGAADVDALRKRRPDVEVIDR